MSRPPSTAAATSPAEDFTYLGGKGLDGVWQWLIGLMPTHAFYVEPFAGKGALLRNKPPALESLLIDLDPAVCDWWRRLAWPGTSVINGDGIHWLETAGRELQADSLVYCDPPYLPSTRRKKRLYAFEMTADDHRRLLRVLQELECLVMLSGYPSLLYDRTLRAWHVEEREVITRGRGTTRKERVWCNFDPARASPALALVYGSLGRNFRERERVARKISRWVSRMAAMPDPERRAILLALLDWERSQVATTGSNSDGRGYLRPRR